MYYNGFSCLSAEQKRILAKEDRLTAMKKAKKEAKKKGKKFDKKNSLKHLYNNGKINTVLRLH